MAIFSFPGLPVIGYKSVASRMELPTSTIRLVASDTFSMYPLVFMETRADSIDKDLGSVADSSAAYLETPEGQLRLDLAFANLQDFLPKPVGSLLALDFGSGPGAIGVRLARLGLSVTLGDISIQLIKEGFSRLLESLAVGSVKLFTVLRFPKAVLPSRVKSFERTARRAERAA